MFSSKENEPVLTLAEVTAKWEAIRRRIKTRKDGAKIAALFAGYTIIGIEEVNQIPVVVCKANSDFHYKALQYGEYHNTIRWALKVELNMECDIRLLSPQAQITSL